MSTTYSTSSIEIDDNLSQTCSQDSSPTENSSFSPSTCASSAKKQKQLGRKNNPEADILSQFYTLRGSTTGQPKKEYLRCKLIRGHKRANRQIEKKMLPAKSFNFYNKDNQDSIAN